MPSNINVGGQLRLGDAIVAALFIATILASSPLHSQSRTPVLHMASGQELKGIPVTVGRASVTWRLPGSSSGGMTIPNLSLIHI